MMTTDVVTGSGAAWTVVTAGAGAAGAFSSVTGAGQVVDAASHDDAAGAVSGAGAGLWAVPSVEAGAVGAGAAGAGAGALEAPASFADG